MPLQGSSLQKEFWFHSNPFANDSIDNGICPSCLFVLWVLTAHSYRLQPWVCVMCLCAWYDVHELSFTAVCPTIHRSLSYLVHLQVEGLSEHLVCHSASPFPETPSLLLFLPFCPAFPALSVNLKCTKKSLPSFHFLCGAPRSDSISPQLRKLTWVVS